MSRLTKFGHHGRYDFSLRLHRDYLDALSRQFCDRFGIDAVRKDDSRSLGGRRGQCRIEREPQPVVQHDPGERAAAGFAAAVGEAGVVDDGGVGANEDRVVLVAYLLDAPAGSVAGKSGRDAVGERDPAVERQWLASDAQRGGLSCASDEFFVQLCRFFARMPVSTSTPALLSLSNPLPETSGLGSSMGQTTRVIPASIRASVQGGVLPWWSCGSRERTQCRRGPFRPASSQGDGLGVRSRHP